ncbi:MAG: hypothetical protein ACR2OM_02235 [Aestuariivirgaceae bacterium]
MADQPRDTPPSDPEPSVSAWYAMTLCSHCKAARLLHWQRDSDVSFGGADRPLHAVVVDGHWAVVHCDYFRRRVELPDQLTFCAAKRAV